MNFKIKQIIIGLICIAAAVTLRITVGFSSLTDNLVLLFFVLLGCRFAYENVKRKGKD